MENEKRLHLICNAHLDPVWQWEWEEGAAAALSTFRAAARFCREFDGFIFCHNEALLYEWVEEYEPSLFAEITSLIREGKWVVMGGWQLQPDCNMPSGEAIVRNILMGRRFFGEKCGTRPTTAINFDPFGHSRGLVQIMASCGFEGYMICRPNQSQCACPAETFDWVGYDGSVVRVGRAPDYNSPKGEAVDKIDRYVKAANENGSEISFCLWGVGNHGGGPSRKDLREIAAKIGEWKSEGVRVLHSTPTAYFTDLRASGKTLPRVEKDLNPWAVGCYLSQVRVKQKNRELESRLWTTEKLCSQLAATTDFAYPAREIAEAQHDLVTIQFHDALPGSSIQPAEEMALRIADHGLELLSRVSARAFFALCQGQPEAKEGEIPILIYNPHPYPVSGAFESEFMLADQNWSGTFTDIKVYEGNTPLPSQVEKENSNIPLDWRKRVCFYATLPPMTVSRFDCHLSALEKKPIPALSTEKNDYLFTSPRMRVKINRETGLLDEIVVDGEKKLAAGAGEILVFRDTEDPWGMTVDGWHDRIGAFSLMSSEEGSAFSALDDVIPSVRVVEDGEVRTVVEAVFGWEKSGAVLRYKLGKREPTVELSVRLINTSRKQLYKLRLPCLATPDVSAQVMYGEENLAAGRENIHQQYLRVTLGDGGFTVLDKGTYGYSAEGNDLLLSLMRSPAYTAHPIGDRRILPGDRYSVYMEQGERLFDFRLDFTGIHESAARLAQVYNESPIVLSFFPSGEKSARENKPFLTLTDGPVTMNALKRAEDGKGYILRLHNPTSHEAGCRVDCPAFGISEWVAFTPFRISSFRLEKERMTPCNPMEEPTA